MALSTTFRLPWRREQRGHRFGQPQAGQHLGPWRARARSGCTSQSIPVTGRDRYVTAYGQGGPTERQPEGQQGAAAR